MSAGVEAPGRLVRHARLWIWGALSISIVICVVMAWLHVEQHKAFGEALAHERSELDHARMDALARTAAHFDTLFESAAALGILLLAGVCWLVYAVGRATAISERKRAQAEDAIRTLNADLEQRVEDRTTELARVNAALSRTNAGLEAEILERAALEDQIRRHADRSHALAQLSTAFAEASLQLDVLYDRIIQRTTEMIGDACLVTQISDDGKWQSLIAFGHLDPEAATLMKKLVHTTPTSVDVGLSGRVARTGQPLLVPIVDVVATRSEIQPSYLPYLDAKGMASLLIVPLRARGRVLGTLGISRDQPGRPYTEDDKTYLQDVADRAGLALDNARLFADLRRAHEVAERANLSKSEFLASMSHELRTPLNAVLGLSEALEENVYGPLTERQLLTIRRIGDSGTHLLALINDILDLSKIEAGKMKLDVAPLSLKDICRAALQLVQGAAQKKGHRMSLDVAHSHVTIEGDARRLVQVLVNLLGNAVKFTPDGGEIELTACVSEETETARLSVRDNGIGIAPEQIGRLFQPFVQLDAGLARKHAGTGLGLALVRRFVEMHGGTVDVESTPGEGSCFAVVIPLTPCETPPPRAVRDRIPERR